MASNHPGFLLTIHGMTCAGCVARVEKAIARIPHATIAVDLLQHQAQVDGVSVDAAIAAIRAAGYEASLVPRATAPNRDPFGPTSAPASPTGDTSSRTIVALIIAGLALVLSFIDMGFMLTGHHWMPVAAAMGLASLALILYGYPMLPKALAAVRRGSANMQTLLLLGSGTAYAWSTGVWLGVWSGPVYFEATTVVLSMHHLGQWLEARARRRAIDALEPYLSSSAEQARRVDGPEADNRVVMVPAQELRPGQEIRVESGEALVADGLVVGGEGLVDESLLTGESMPVQRHSGQLVYAGTRLLSGALTLRIQMPPDQWRRDVIGQQLQQALMSKAPIAAMADRLAAHFVPFVVILAFINALGQWWLGIEPAAIIERTIAILVVACPCALGLATPTAIAAGLAVAARHGWLFRNAGAIESLARTTHFALDKTGTLTMGRPKLLAIQSAHESVRPIVQADFPSWLALACRAEEGSQHPLAGALLSHVAGRPMPSLRSVETLPGRGLLAQTDDGRMVCIGSSNWVASLASTQRPSEEPEQWEHASCIEVAQQNGDWLGRVWIGDTLRPGAQHLVSALKKMGVQVALISGDRPAAVEAAAHAVGIEPNMVTAQASPESKSSAFSDWRAAGGVVAMVGDGLNDSLALGQADVGIAMAAGASTAVQAADVTLTNSQDISQLLGVLELARDTVSRVRQNLFFAFVFNVSALPAAAFGWLSPALAGGAMAMSAALVAGHAVGLLRWKRSPVSEPA